MSAPMHQDTVAFSPVSPPSPTAPDRVRVGGITAAAIASLGIACGFLIAATAENRGDASAAGWLLGLSAFVAFMGAVSFPKREPGVAMGLGAISLAIGVLCMSATWEMPYLLMGMLGYAIARLVAKHALPIGRIAAGIAGLLVIVAWTAKAQDAKDVLPAVAYTFAALGVIDSFATFARASTIARGQSDAQRKPTMT
jgi:hypothetical protein